MFRLRELRRRPPRRSRRARSRASTARCSTTPGARSPAASTAWSSRAGSRTSSRAPHSSEVSTGIDVHTVLAAGGRGRRHHAVQLPGDGAAVDARQRAGVRQRVRAQAVGEGPVGVAAAGRAGAGGGVPRRRAHRRAGRRRGGRRAAGAPRRRRRLVRRAAPRSRGTSTRPARKHGKRVQALGGAKNHMVVLPDADVDAAADAAISAGYGSAGERCMAISVVVAVGAVADPLVEAIAARIPDVVVGPGDDGASMMGPLITREHRDRVQSYLGARGRRGCRGRGRRLAAAPTATGCATGSSSGAR